MHGDDEKDYILPKVCHFGWIYRRIMKWKDQQVEGTADFNNRPVVLKEPVSFVEQVNEEPKEKLVTTSPVQIELSGRPVTPTNQLAVESAENEGQLIFADSKYKFGKLPKPIWPKTPPTIPSTVYKIRNERVIVNPNYD